MGKSNSQPPTCPHPEPPRKRGRGDLLGGGDALERWGHGEEGGGMGPTRRRKTKHERTALAAFAELELERAAMTLRELAADKETQPGSRLRAESGIIDAEEALEDLVLLVARDADAAVFDDQRRAAVADDCQLDPRPPSAVGQRVVDQVIDDARQLLAVGGDRDRLVRLAVPDLRPPPAAPRPRPAHRPAGHLPEVQR